MVRRPLALLRAAFLPLLLGSALALTLAPVASRAMEVHFAETVTPLTGSATFTGTARDVGTAPQQYAYFSCLFVADQTGTAEIDGSNDGTTWFAETTSTAGALSASTPLILSVPVLSRYTRCKLVNGSSAEGSLTVASSFTGG